jgi:hypothetical protein
MLLTVRPWKYQFTFLADITRSMQMWKYFSFYNLADFLTGSLTAWRRNTVVFDNSSKEPRQLYASWAEFSLVWMHGKRSEVMWSQVEWSGLEGDALSPQMPR